MHAKNLQNFVQLQAGFENGQTKLFKRGVSFIGQDGFGG